MTSAALFSVFLSARRGTLRSRITAARREEDCIACLSCRYECPSGAISQTDYHVVKNFYRDLTFVKNMERFL